MKRIVWFTAVVMLYSAAALQGAIPRLHVDGNQIKDPEGNVVVLRGISLIDLGFLESWQGGAINMINRLTSQTDTQGQSPSWHPKVIRIPIAPPDSVSGWPYPFNPNNTVLYDLLRTVVDYCATKDLYVIIDWHYIANTYEHVDSTSAFWTYMAPRFAEDEHVMYELFNEPINNTFGSEAANWASVKTDMQTWINIVRASAPDTMLLVAGPNWSQAIGPMVSNPVSDPIGGNNIAAVSHIYPGHWSNPSWYQGHIETCAAAYPIIMTEWGFTSSGDSLLIGTITGYGLPLMDWIEERGISNTAWVASYDWGPPMFNGDWTLRCGEGEMGCFVKDMLYLRRNRDLPGGGGDLTAPAEPTGLAASAGEGMVTLDWNDNSEGDLLGYYVYRSATSGGSYTKLNYWPSGDSTYIDSSVNGGTTYYYVVTAVDDSANESIYSYEENATPASAGQNPYPGPDAHMIPGRIEAENYDTGGEGAAYHDTTSGNSGGSYRSEDVDMETCGDTGGGYNVGWIAGGEWLEYTVVVSAAGDYDIELRVASQSTGGNLHIEMNGVNVTGTLSFPATGGWQTYTSIYVYDVPLAAGEQIMRISMDTGNWNINWVEFTGGPVWFYGDLTENGIVDMEDLPLFIENHWMAQDCGELDLNGDCVIGLYEFAEFARNWIR